MNVCEFVCYIIYSYENAFDILIDRFYQVKSYKKRSGNRYSGTRCTRGCPSFTVSITIFNENTHIASCHRGAIEIDERDEIKITSSTCNFFLVWKIHRERKDFLSRFMIGNVKTSLNICKSFVTPLTILQPYHQGTFI